MGLMLASTVYWYFKVRRIDACRRLPIPTLFMVFTLMLIVTAIMFLQILHRDTYVLEDIICTTTLPILFLFQVLYLLFMTVRENRAPALWVYAFCFMPSVAYVASLYVVTLILGFQVAATTPWVQNFSTVGYNLLLFSNIVVAIFFFFYKYYFYRKEVFNRLANLEDTDFAPVRGIFLTFLVCGLVAYLTLILLLKTFVGNLALVSLMMVLMLVVIHLLGYSLTLFRGRPLPALRGSLPTVLTREGILSLKQRFQEADRVLASIRGTQNIGLTIEDWTNRPDKPFLRQGITEAEVADQMKIPVSLLSGYLNKTLGVGFNQWVNSFRLKHAKFLLLTTQLSLDEVAETCGFTNRSHLSRTMKVQEGITPSEYRLRKNQD